MAEEGSLKNIRLTFSQDAFDRLEDIQRDLGGSTRARAETIRHAPGVLSWVVEQLRGGNVIQVVRSDGTATEVEFPFTAQRSS